uniref:Uncharacterized protein n=1 Tax=Solanum tuberosum TaxID=4113 RepID=M1DSW7_SOLTU
MDGTDRPSINGWSVLVNRHSRLGVTWGVDPRTRATVRGSGHGSTLRQFSRGFSGEGCRCEPRTTSKGRGSPSGPWVATVGYTCNFWKSALRSIKIDKQLIDTIDKIIVTINMI